MCEGHLALIIWGAHFYASAETKGEVSANTFVLENSPQVMYFSTRVTKKEQQLHSSIWRGAKLHPKPGKQGEDHASRLRRRTAAHIAHGPSLDCGPAAPLHHLHPQLLGSVPLTQRCVCTGETMVQHLGITVPVTNNIAGQASIGLQNQSKHTLSTDRMPTPIQTY